MVILTLTILGAFACTGGKYKVFLLLHIVNTPTFKSATKDPSARNKHVHSPQMLLGPSLTSVPAPAAAAEANTQYSLENPAPKARVMSQSRGRFNHAPCCKVGLSRDSGIRGIELLNFTIFFWGVFFCVCEKHIVSNIYGTFVVSWSSNILLVVIICSFSVKVTLVTLNCFNI